MTGNEAKLKEFLKTETIDTFVTGLSFEEGVTILDLLVKRVESGDLPLAQAVTSYERGAHLVTHLRTVLSKAEAKLQQLHSDGKVREMEAP
jgi:exodeoxyribonuclease VII small subunit